VGNFGVVEAANVLPLVVVDIARPELNSLEFWQTSSGLTPGANSSRYSSGG